MAVAVADMDLDEIRQMTIEAMDIAKTTNELVAKDRKYLPLMRAADALVDRLKELGREAQRAQPDFQYADEDGMHTIESPTLDRNSRRARDSALRRMSAQAARYDQEREIGESIKRRFNPHYRDR